MSQFSLDQLIKGVVQHSVHPVKMNHAVTENWEDKNRLESYFADELFLVSSSHTGEQYFTRPVKSRVLAEFTKCNKMTLPWVWCSRQENLDNEPSMCKLTLGLANMNGIKVDPSIFSAEVRKLNGNDQLPKVDLKLTSSVLFHARLYAMINKECNPRDIVKEGISTLSSDFDLLLRILRVKTSFGSYIIDKQKWADLVTDLTSDDSVEWIVATCKAQKLCHVMMSAPRVKISIGEGADVLLPEPYSALFHQKSSAAIESERTPVQVQDWNRTETEVAQHDEKHDDDQKVNAQQKQGYGQDLNSEKRADKGQKMVEENISQSDNETSNGNTLVAHRKQLKQPHETETQKNVVQFPLASLPAKQDEGPNFDSRIANADAALFLAVNQYSSAVRMLQMKLIEAEDRADEAASRLAEVNGKMRLVEKELQISKLQQTFFKSRADEAESRLAEVNGKMMLVEKELEFSKLRLASYKGKLNEMQGTVEYQAAELERINNELDESVEVERKLLKQISKQQKESREAKVLQGSPKIDLLDVFPQRAKQDCSTMKYLLEDDPLPQKQEEQEQDIGSTLSVNDMNEVQNSPDSSSLTDEEICRAPPRSATAATSHSSTRSSYAKRRNACTHQ